MKKIAFDILGNDNGTKAAIEAAIEFVNEEKEFSITLVGDKNDIEKYDLPSTITVLHSPKEVEKENKSRAARKSDSSMMSAINLVISKEVDAVLSSGDSAVYLSMLTLVLKRLKGLRRPAFMPIIPTTVSNKKSLFLDVGANDIATGEMLYQWGKIAKVFAEEMLNIKNPKVAVLNIGTEKTKGFDYHSEADSLLSKDKNLNYIGYIEPRYILNNKADVYLSDGYAGNMVLKSLEGTTLALLSVIKRNLKSNFISKVGALLSKGAYKKTMKDLDYRNVGAAWVIGVNALALKAHGSSDKKSYLGALNQIKLAIETDTFNKIKDVLDE